MQEYKYLNLLGCAINTLFVYNDPIVILIINEYQRSSFRSLLILNDFSILFSGNTLVPNAPAA